MQKVLKLTFFLITILSNRYPLENTFVSKFTILFIVLIREDTVLIQSIPCCLLLNIRDKIAFFILAFRNCAEIFKSGQKRDGVYVIKPDNQSAFDVFCDQTTAGGGWTVFQKRIDGSVDFNLNWSDYKHGFGNLSGEFWLGLDRIHRLTLDNNSMLRVDMEDFEGGSAYAEYSFFGVRSEHEKYQLILGSYNTAGD